MKTKAVFEIAEQPAPQGDEITFPWECEVGGETLRIYGGNLRPPEPLLISWTLPGTGDFDEVIPSTLAKAIIRAITTLQTENAQLRAHLSPRPEPPLEPTPDGEGRG